MTSAYANRVDEYVASFGSMDDVAASDAEFVERWARNVDGSVLDVGSGPGQWTNHLADLGLNVEGVEPVAQFVTSARRRFPDVRYRVGTAEALGVDDGALGGILAWYSLIHLDENEIDAALVEFARCIKPGGWIALGFFVGEWHEPFDHAVFKAYFWPIDELRERLESAGFAVTHAETRTDPAARPHGALLARRLAS